MGRYKGKPYSIPLERGGLSFSRNKELISPESMVEGSKNLNLNGSRAKRGGTSILNETPVSGSPQIMGIFDFMKPGGTAYIVFATTDGKLWKNTTTTLKTGLTTGKFVSMEQFGSKVYFCNGADVPHSWNGTDGAASALTLIPSDWTGVNHPVQIIRHGRGNSERLWAIGCPSTPYTVYASKNGVVDFSDVEVKTLNIDTGDGYGIVGAVVYDDKLLCFGRNKTYVIDDADTSVSNWGYFASPWEGGVAHHRLIVKTPNDLICMSEEGEIYSVMAAQEHGDYKKASLTRESYLHEWIRKNLRLSYINRFHGVYDKTLRAIKFFVVRTGQTTVDTALVYFIDRPPAEAWMIHDNLSYDSGYEASCSAEIRVGMGEYEIYTGDYGGQIWHLEQTAKNDNDQLFWAGFKTPPLGLNDERFSEIYDKGWLILEPQGTEVLGIQWWVNGVSQTARTITAASGIRRYLFELGTPGENIQLQVYNNVKDTDFCLDEMIIDFRPVGLKLK